MWSISGRRFDSAHLHHCTRETARPPGPFFYGFPLSTKRSLRDSMSAFWEDDNERPMESMRKVHRYTTCPDRKPAAIGRRGSRVSNGRLGRFLTSSPSTAKRFSLCNLVRHTKNGRSSHVPHLEPCSQCGTVGAHHENLRWHPVGQLR